MSAEPYPKFYLYHRVVKAKLFIDGHFAEKIDLDLIADEAHFSKFHFNRLFKSIYGKTPHQHLTRTRIGEAKRLLQDGAAVSDACFAVGFQSITSFTALFKSTEGITPSQFRLEQIQRARDLKEQPLSFIPNCYAARKGWTLE